MFEIESLENEFDNEFEVKHELLEEFRIMIQILDTMKEINILTKIYEEEKLNEFIDRFDDLKVQDLMFP